MKRGEIYYANLDPTIGSEIKKTRPVLIVSNDANNKAASTITIVPITSNVNKIYPFEVFLKKNKTGLDKESKAQCHQLRTISKLRLGSQMPVGMIDSQIQSAIDYSLKLHLGL